MLLQPGIDYLKKLLFAEIRVKLCPEIIDNQQISGEKWGIYFINGYIIIENFTLNILDQVSGGDIDNIVEMCIRDRVYTMLSFIVKFIITKS